MESFTLHFDGSCGPTNPGGTAAFGFVLHKTGQKDPITSGHGIIGSGPGMTNNVAEFHALATGLKECANQVANQTTAQVRPLLSVLGDSKLVIEVMNKRWRPKFTAAYFDAYLAADLNLKALRRAGVTVTFTHVRREHNQECDALSKAHQTRVTATP